MLYARAALCVGRVVCVACACRLNRTRYKRVVCINCMRVSHVLYAQVVCAVCAHGGGDRGRGGGEQQCVRTRVLCLVCALSYIRVGYIHLTILGPTHSDKDRWEGVRSDRSASVQHIPSRHTSARS